MPDPFVEASSYADQLGMPDGTHELLDRLKTRIARTSGLALQQYPPAVAGGAMVYFVAVANGRHRDYSPTDIARVAGVSVSQITDAYTAFLQALTDNGEAELKQTSTWKLETTTPRQDTSDTTDS